MEDFEDAQCALPFVLRFSPLRISSLPPININGWMVYLPIGGAKPAKIDFFLEDFVHHCRISILINIIER